MKTDALVERLVGSYGNWVQKDCKNTEGGTGRYTRELWPCDTMFSPIQVNRLTIKNRLVMALMGNRQMAEMREYFLPAPRAASAIRSTPSIPARVTRMCCRLAQYI